MESIQLVFEAARYAADSHANQKREAMGEPYINHFIEVAELV